MLFILILVINVNSKETATFTVSGNIYNAPKDITILLKEYNTLQNSQTVLEKIKLLKNEGVVIKNGIVLDYEKKTWKF